MSKEREFLKKLRYASLLENDLRKELEELLAQPEQEPVAWMYEWHEGDTESTSTYCGSEKPFQEDEVKPFNLRPLYEHPKRNELTPRQGLAEYKRGYARAGLDLKREPLGLEIMDVCGSEDYREGFKDGALYAEKCHGIGVDDE